MHELEYELLQLAEKYSGKDDELALKLLSLARLSHNFSPPIVDTSPPQNKVTWLDDVLECFNSIGGEAHLSDIYHWFEYNKTRRIMKGGTHTGIIRRTIYQHSSDCDAFLGKKDLFISVGSKNSGLWAIRKSNRRKLWTEEEIIIAVETYCDMLEMEEAGVKYNKSQIYNILKNGPNPTRTHPPGLLPDRSIGSIEMRMCNISSVLSDFSKEIIPGLKPLKNVGKNNYSIIEKRLKELGKI